jgi:hypothetical protein
MASVNDFMSDRTAAGERYAAAVTELREAYVELHAIDLALKSSKVAPHLDVLTFRGDLDQVPVEQRHPQFAPGSRVGMIDAVRSRCDQIVKTFNGLPREA